MSFEETLLSLAELPPKESVNDILFTKPEGVSATPYPTQLFEDHTLKKDYGKYELKGKRSNVFDVVNNVNVESNNLGGEKQVEIVHIDPCKICQQKMVVIIDDAELVIIKEILKRNYKCRKCFEAGCPKCVTNSVCINCNN